MTEWMDSAKCRSIDPDLFHPGETGKWNARSVREALKVCGRCPVSIECLNWAFETEDTYAILGGTTPEMRSQFVKSFGKVTGEAA
jgi:WhiB family transcriptional regulator, redox-sensing transcriptional regulator